MTENYLIHHGVKGMKWGVRKKQELAALGADLKTIKKPKNITGAVAAGVKARAKLHQHAHKNFKENYAKPAAEVLKPDDKAIVDNAKENRWVKAGAFAVAKALKRMRKAHKPGDRVKEVYVDITKAKIAKKIKSKKENQK